MNFLCLTILSPLISCILIILFNKLISYKYSAILGIGSIGLSVIITIFIIIDFSYNCSTGIFKQCIGYWITINDFLIPIVLYLDELSIILLSVIVFIGLLVNFYSIYYIDNNDISRFFVYINLFISSMLILVLSDNLLIMYLGWEIVGLCSYLLIGFYYIDINNSRAAMKAFIFTRIGDISLILFILIIYNQIGTLNISEIKILLEQNTKLISNNVLILSTFMLLISAISKSAQVPLHTWLVDAMVGPTPASALIHSATMVTAGVYLITRTNIFFILVPNILTLISIIGTFTLLFAGLSALIQTDIKRVLAYSTISQIGYMFLSIGVQEFNGAIFHLVIHAFFKALLFLSVGSIIKLFNYEQNIFKLGMLKNNVPIIYTSFLIGALSLSGFPILTSGFYSKERILLSIFFKDHILLTIFGLIGIFITSLYIFRIVYLIFYGTAKNSTVIDNKNIFNNIPLYILLILSTFIGAKILPNITNIFPIEHILYNNNKKILITLITSIISILGIIVASKLWSSSSNKILYILKKSKYCIYFKWILNDCFDWCYDKVFIKSYYYLINILTNSYIYTIIDNIVITIYNKTIYILVKSINGILRWYILSINIGAIIFLSILYFINHISNLF